MWETAGQHCLEFDSAWISFSHIKLLLCMLLHPETKDINFKLWVTLCGKVKLTNYFFFPLAIRQAIAKSLVAYYQKCEYPATYTV